MEKRFKEKFRRNKCEIINSIPPNEYSDKVGLRGARYQVYKLLSKNYSKKFSKNYSIFFFKLGSGEQGIKFTNYYQKSTMVYICFFDKEDVQTRTYDQCAFKISKHYIFMLCIIFYFYPKVCCKEVGFIPSHSIRC